MVSRHSAPASGSSPVELQQQDVAAGDLRQPAGAGIGALLILLGLVVVDLHLQVARNATAGLLERATCAVGRDHLHQFGIEQAWPESPSRVSGSAAAPTGFTGVVRTLQRVGPELATEMARTAGRHQLQPPAAVLTAGPLVQRRHPRVALEFPRPAEAGDPRQLQGALHGEGHGSAIPSGQGLVLCAQAHHHGRGSFPGFVDSRD